MLSWPTSAQRSGSISSILPLVVYELLGTSRQLILGPTRRPVRWWRPPSRRWPPGMASFYASVSAALYLFAGVFCVGASFLRLGALADFLSKSILVGFLNGIALSIVLGQLGKLFGFSIAAGDIIPPLLEFIGGGAARFPSKPSQRTLKFWPDNS